MGKLARISTDVRLIACFGHITMDASAKVGLIGSYSYTHRDVIIRYGKGGANTAKLTSVETSAATDALLTTEQNVVSSKVWVAS